MGKEILAFEDCSESAKINFAIDKWEKRHMPKTTSINGKNFEEVFASIYAFRSVIDIIDVAIADHIVSTAREELQKIPFTTPVGNCTLEVKLSTNPKYKTLAETWAKLGDVHFPASASIDFSNIMKLRYANYMGFIHSIIEHDYVIYEIE